MTLGTFGKTNNLFMSYKFQIGDRVCANSVRTAYTSREGVIISIDKGPYFAIKVNFYGGSQVWFNGDELTLYKNGVDKLDGIL